MTELLGQGVNLVTGDYSRGAAGYWVEGGEIALPGGGDHHRRQPARHVQAASSPIGSDVMVRSGRSCGSILIENMTIAGD